MPLWKALKTMNLFPHPPEIKVWNVTAIFFPGSVKPDPEILFRISDPFKL